MNKGYKKFLHSDKWQAIRKAYHGNKDKKCFICEKAHNLQIHHLSYLGDEVLHTWGLTDPVNLVLLCGQCHLLVKQNIKLFEKKFESAIKYHEMMKEQSWSKKKKLRKEFNKKYKVPKMIDINGDGSLMVRSAY